MILIQVDDLKFLLEIYSAERKLIVFNLENPFVEGKKLLDRIVKNLEGLQYLADVKIAIIKRKEIVENCDEQKLRGQEFYFLLDPGFGMAIKQRSGNVCWLTFVFPHDLDHIKSMVEYHYS